MKENINSMFYPPFSPQPIMWSCGSNRPPYQGGQLRTVARRDRDTAETGDTVKFSTELETEHV